MSSRDNRRVRPKVISVLAFLVALAALSTAWAVTGTAATVAFGLPRFSQGSVFNQKIAPGAAIDPQSKTMMAPIVSDASRVINLVEFGVPVYIADQRTPRRRFACTMPWGTCAPQASSPVPIPDGARPNGGSDGAMVVVDIARRRTYEFWQAVRLADGSWRASWASSNSLDGTGTGSGGSGSGVSRIAGMVSVLEASHPTAPIKHALAVSTKYACRDRFRYPASKTDGGVASPQCVPEGARLQLDPAIDVAKIPGITPGEAMIARALQQFGAFVVDRGGASLAFLFQHAYDGAGSSPGTIYKAAGFAWDYFGLRKIPWARLRVLAPVPR